MVALAGMDAKDFLLNEDAFEVATMQAVASRAREMREIEDRNRAVWLANGMWGGSSG